MAQDLCGYHLKCSGDFDFILETMSKDNGEVLLRAWMWLYRLHNGFASME